MSNQAQQNDIGASGAKELGKYLATNDSLTYLNLSVCQLTILFVCVLLLILEWCREMLLELVVAISTGTLLLSTKLYKSSIWLFVFHFFFRFVTCFVTFGAEQWNWRVWCEDYRKGNDKQSDSWRFRLGCLYFLLFLLLPFLSFICRATKLVSGVLRVFPCLWETIIASVNYTLR